MITPRSLAIRGMRTWLAPSLRRFQAQLDDPVATQAKLLRSMIPDWSRTAYGRDHHLAPTDSIEAFRRKMPIATPASLAAWSDHHAQAPGLVCGRPRFWEQTSGSTGAPRSIPYTPGLIGVCNRLFTLWASDLLLNGPDLRTGRLFLSVSPKLDSRPGADSDTDFLGEAWQTLLRPFLIIPRRISTVSEPLSFRHVLALLLLSGDPEVISIWNPSFLLVLMEHVEQFRELIRGDWTRGGLVVQGHAWRFRPPSSRQMQLISASDLSWPDLLPSLKVISCWSDAQAGPGAQRLAHRFPGCLIQGKGLLATEAPMTIPLIEAAGCVPLVADVFYEFEDSSGGLHLIEDLRCGEEYQIIITPRGGFCRYRISDVVRFTHVYRRSPCLSFVGRARSSDLAGEKLHDGFVADVLRDLGCGTTPRTLIPVRPDHGPAYYVLAVTEPGPADKAQGLDQALMAAMRYREARMLGQLAAPRIVVVPHLETTLLDQAHARGLAWGDLKPTALYPCPLSEARIQEWAHAY